MLSILIIISCLIAYFAYRFYGNFLDRRCGIDDKNKTPSETQQDGIDYIPTKASVLFGHHFSSIAGAGPIVGPILAGMYFGWGPTWLWIIIGSIFVGGIHDFGSSFMSVRSNGNSITVTTRKLIGENIGKLFLIFVILALIYVIVVFLDLTASTFTSTPEVATASGWFIFTALAFGFVNSRKLLPLKWAIIVFVPLTYIGFFIGNEFPLTNISKDAWIIIVLIYCFIAATLPINILLQPRDFLSATFLYAMMFLGILGLFFSNAPIQIEFYKSWNHEKAGTLIPILFITVACGACSGFHSIVASGTTSKQISKETDIKRVSYGAMLVEGVLAVFALACLAVLSTVTAEGLSPIQIFAKGTGVFMNALHIPVDLGEKFALLALSTFLLTTLDTCTRLCRFLMEELLDIKTVTARYTFTLITLILSACVVFQSFDGISAWKAIWPLFGATNQLMAALALVTFMVYLKAHKINYNFVLVPTILMIIMPLTALFLIVINKGIISMLGSIALFMLLLGLVVIGMSLKFVFTNKLETD